MNQPEYSRDADTSIGDVFVLGFEDYDLFYVPANREVVSLLEADRTADRAPASTAETRKD
jgi:hypothetical protein